MTNLTDSRHINSVITLIARENLIMDSSDALSNRTWIQWN